MSLPGNKILDLLISMTLIYALLSLLVSVLLEWWNHKKKTRAIELKASIFQLLNDSLNLQFGELFYNHFLIDGLKNKTEKRLPQYVSSSLFAEVLIDIISNRYLRDFPVQLIGHSTEQGKQYKLGEKPPVPALLDQFKHGLDQLNPSPLTDTLHSFLTKSEGDVGNLKKMLASWFDDYMDRASGWYKQKQRNKLYFFGFLVAIALNVDSLHLVKMISLDDNLRNNLVQSADQLADQYDTLSDSARQKTDELEKILTMAFSDSTLKNEEGKLLLEPLKKFLANKVKDSTAKAGLLKLDSLIMADSISREYQQRANRILNVATSLNIPIGWDEASAPLSWLSKPTRLSHQAKEIKAVNQNELMDYLDRRNQRSGWNMFKYLIGIVITGFSLSFGAPFWFDVLVKLVNIRRAGKKPEATNVK